MKEDSFNLEAVPEPDKTRPQEGHPVRPW